MLISRYLEQISLQNNLDDWAPPLVSASFDSPDEDMEVYTIPNTEAINDLDGRDSDVEVIACYREMTFASHLILLEEQQRLLI